MSQCLTVDYRRIGGGLDVSLERKGGGCGVTLTRAGGRLSVSYGLVCTSSLGEYILWGRDGIIYNVYGDKIYLTKK